MLCNKCGTLIGTNDKFCSGCGIEIEHTEKVVDQEVDKKDLLIKTYIGKNYNAVLNKMYSFNAFLFGAFYLLYRKMYLIAFSWLLTSFILSLFLSVNNMLLVNFAFSIYLMLFFKKLYLADVKRKIEKIMIDNSDKSITDLVIMVSAKGGTNLLIPMLMSVIYFVVALSTALSNLYPESNGVIGDLNLYIPEAWEEAGENTFQQPNKNCTVTISNIQKSYTSDEYADAFIDIVNASSGNVIDRKEQKINGHSWVYVSAKYDGELYYTYFTEKNDKNYTIIYEIKEETDLVCRENVMYLEHSLEFK